MANTSLSNSMEETGIFESTHAKLTFRSILAVALVGGWLNKFFEFMIFNQMLQDVLLYTTSILSIVYLGIKIVSSFISVQDKLRDRKKSNQEKKD